MSEQMSDDTPPELPFRDVASAVEDAPGQTTVGPATEWEGYHEDVLNAVLDG